MEFDQLQNGVSLKEQIEKTEKIISEWEKAKSLGNDGVYTFPSAVWIKADPETFEVFKVLNLNSFNKKLKDLKEQFAAL